ncbi:MAG TPA: hypothetical protein VFR47_06555 [Anaerolineales bacterium]|nr:hypothetical protein [Anaerolineales bacterium]
MNNLKPTTVNHLTANLSRRSILWIILISGIWLLLWFAPWQGLAAFSIWVQLGVALLIFILPGLCIYGLIQTESRGWLNYFTFGFVISHLLLAVFGTLGRLIHLPFVSLKHGMMALSLILLLLYATPRLASIRLPLFDVSAIRKILSYWPLALMVVLAGLMTIQRTLSDDDLSYLAYLTNWQFAPALHFNDVFFGVDKLAPVRFWLVSTPFSQAYLSDLSGLPGIFVVGGHYEPFLAALALCSLYALARTLGLSHRKAMASVIFQVSFLSLLSEYLHPGAPFFRQLSTDKASAAYIFIPVFLQSIIWYLGHPSRHKLILILLTGSSLMLMHPAALVFAVMVAGFITVFGLEQANLRARIGLLIALLVVISPQIATRFVRHEAQAAIPFSMEEILSARGIETMISVWDDTNFYGFNPSILAMRIPYAERLPIPIWILQYGWLVFPLLGAVLALKNVRRDFLSQYVLACFLLGALAGIPFTGWLLGYVVSAWMLERTLWIYPFGIGTVFVLTAVSERIGLTNRLRRWMQALEAQTRMDPRPWLFSTLTILAAFALWLVMREQDLPNIARLTSNTERYTEFALIGNFLDDHIQHMAFAVGTDELNDYIPAISSKAKVISYRPSDPSYPYFYTPLERNQRLLDRQSIFSREIAVQERISLIQKHDIRFLWLKGGEYSLVKNMLSEFPTMFSEHKVGGYYLIEVH